MSGSRMPGACRLVVPVASDSRHRLGRTLVLQIRDCARTRSPRADCQHQVSVADIIPAGPLKTAPLVVSRMPFVMVEPLVGLDRRDHRCDVDGFGERVNG
ncbi:hypothetical protein Zmor_001912 [Zophobas morio]|uniref:Uncharacterized protein n=1 Tax=Zophobas morio TaxID=2755281 RepID=A0AA38MT87_9CUCU|nr:hypothetical protein Zmor_001912 [Zophobas morio]